MLKVRRLEHAAGLPLPAYATEGAAGIDLSAAIEDTLTIGPGERSLVPTGYAWEIPAGFEGQVRPRSGLAVRHGLTVLNTPGTIDSDYRGEIKVLLINLGDKTVSVTRGDRIAQLVISAVTRVDLHEVAEIAESVRGLNGFGSTGVSQSSGN